MKLSNVYIKNYKSFKEISVDISDNTVIIGENNVGKSNFLKAIDFFLGPKWPMPHVLTVDDFHNNNTADPIIIRLKFTDLTAIELEEYSNHVNDNQLEIEMSCSYGADKIVLKYTHSGVWLRAPNREKIPFVLVPGLRDIVKQSAVNKWTLFGKLLDSVRKTITPELEDEIRVKLTEANDLLLDKVEKLNKIQDKLNQTMNEQTSIDGLKFEFKTFDPTDLLKNVEIHIDDGTKCGSINDKGMGLQSSLIVAIFRLFADTTTDSCIFGIEEPEIYLHPQCQRFLSDTLKRVATNNQVIITTHSPFFIDDVDFKDLILFKRDDNSTVAKKIDPLISQSDISKIRRNLDVGNSEMFFAKAVLLCEGPSEKISFPILAKKLGKNFNYKGISVIDVGSSGNFAPFLMLLKSFDVPSFVMRDSDASGLDLSDYIDRSRIFDLSSDFEGAIGLENLLDAVNSLYGTSLALSSVSSSINAQNPLFKEIQSLVPRSVKLSKPRVARYVSENMTVSDIPSDFSSIISTVYNSV